MTRRDRIKHRYYFDARDEQHEERLDELARVGAERMPQRVETGRRILPALYGCEL